MNPLKKTIIHNKACATFENIVNECNCVRIFLEQSNLIERVFDADSLNQSMYAFEYLLGEDKLNTGIVLKVHKIAMLHVKKLQPHQRGYFRDMSQVNVSSWQAGIKIDSHMHYSKVREAMQKWVLIANRKKTERQIKNDHIRFEEIHPFVDGNGRVGRMLLNWQRIKNGFPLEIFLESKKREYYRWFRGSLTDKQLEEIRFKQTVEMLAALQD